MLKKYWLIKTQNHKTMRYQYCQYRKAPHLNKVVRFRGRIKTEHGHFFTFLHAYTPCNLCMHMHAKAVGYATFKFRGLFEGSLPFRRGLSRGGLGVFNVPEGSIEGSLPFRRGSAEGSLASRRGPPRGLCRSRGGRLGLCRSGGALCLSQGSVERLF
jgi:hypothetical protein